MGSKLACAQGTGKTKGFLWASGQDPALKVGLRFPEVSAKHRIIRMCSFLRIEPDSLPPAHSARAQAGFPGDSW